MVRIHYIYNKNNIMDYNEKYKKVDLEDLIFVQKISYRKIGEKYGVSDTYIKKVCKRLGIELPIRAKFDENFKPVNTGKGKKINCLCCGKEVNTSYDKQLYCNKECWVKHKTEEYYKNYLSNQEYFCDANKDLAPLKKHILIEQNCECDICNIKNVWNGKPMNFILDHINGNASNNMRNNLRLICHNCDSQLDTYKSKNKNQLEKTDI